MSIQDYAGVDTDDFDSLKIYLKAKTNFVVSESAHAITLSVRSRVKVLPPPIAPYFELPLEPVNMTYEYFTDQVFDEVPYKLPKIKDISGGTDLQATVNTTDLDFLRYDKSSKTLYLDPNKVTKKLIRQGLLDIDVQTSNEYGLLGNYTIKVTFLQLMAAEEEAQGDGDQADSEAGD